MLVCVCVGVCVRLCVSHSSVFQRFKGTEPEEDLTEQVKAVKLTEKPKEVKTEVVDEVLPLD